MAKTPKKFRGMPEKVKLPRYVVTGGICSGYTIHDRELKEDGETYENMWDAINEKNRLLQNCNEPI